MRTWHRVTGTLQALTGRRRLDDDLDEELREFYAASVEAKLAAGLPRAEAERAARMEIGSATAVKDWVRDVGWESRLESVWQDVRYAFRMLRRSPGFAVAAIGTLAVGLGATAAMYAVVDAVLVKPFKFDAPDRVVELRFRNPGGGIYGVAGGVMQTVRRLPGVEFAAGTQLSESAIVAGEVGLLALGESVTDEFFEVFGVPAAVGRTFTAADREGEAFVVLSDQLWRRAFGARADIIGQSITMSRIPYRVLGVMPPDFRVTPALPADFWQMRSLHPDELARQGTGPFHVFLRLRSPALDITRAQVAGLDLPPAVGNDGERLTLAIAPLLDVMGRFYGKALWTLLGAMAFVFLLACANVANLVLGRLRQRTPELLVRSAIGAGRGRLMRQLLTECAVIAGLAALAGCVVAALLVDALPLLPLTTINVARIDEVTIDGRVYGFLAIVTVMTVLLVGLVPALAVARRHPVVSSTRTLTTRRGRTSQALIALEIATTVTILAGGALVAMRVWDLMRSDVGFDLRGLHMATTRPLGKEYDAGRLVSFYRAAMDHLRQSSGVQAAVIDIVPLDFRRPAPVPVASAKGGKGAPASAAARVMSAGAVQLIGARVLAGREFTDADRIGTTPVALVNEVLAAKLGGPGESPLGAALTVEREGELHLVTVVGVINDMRGDVYNRPGPEIYLSSAQFPPRRAAFVVRSDAARESVDQKFRDAVRVADPRQAISEAVAVSDRVRTRTALSRFVAVLMALFAALAALLAATGIMAVAAAGVAARTRELGIRVAIGASRADVLRCVARDFLPGVAIGALVGIAAAASLTNVIRWLEPGVAAFNPAVYVGAIVAILVVAAIGAWLPARRALAIDPAIVFNSSEG